MMPIPRPTPNEALVGLLRLSQIFISTSLVLVTSTAALSSPKKPAKKKPAQPKPLHEKSFDEIINKYTFVGDFELKEAERQISDEIFWRYPFAVPKVDFPIEVALKDPKKELPASKGAGRAVDHLNRGRLLFLEGNFEEAKKTWLSGRARYGKEYPFHRRNDYFIGLSFLNQATSDMVKLGKTYEDPEISGNMANAATFYSWAFIMKADQPDELVDALTPKGLYNLAAIYWRYNRFSGAFGAADKGLNFLRATGRKEYRPQLHRVVAEAHIKNQTFLEAVQELDTAIRQDKDPVQAAAMFARVGDIYYGLNNFELAEDAYALGAKIDEDLKQINPDQLTLRAESLFWLGHFSEAQKFFTYALEGVTIRSANRQLSTEAASYAALRIADSYLALKDYDSAKLAYYKVSHEYRGTLASQYAKVREACLELPFYQGNNIKHARELLEEAKEGKIELPPVAVELAWACQVSSYTDRERTADMLERVRSFATTYPESRFLASFAQPIREVQAEKINGYFKAGDIYGAVRFFEKNRKNLFPKVPLELASQLFAAYADIYKPERAIEFWAAYDKEPDEDLKALRQVTVATELVKKPWPTRAASLARALEKRKWRIPPGDLPLSYTMRVLNPKGSGISRTHLWWLFNLAEYWSKTDEKYHCDMEYPLLSRLYDDGSPGEVAMRERVAARIKNLVDSKLPQLLRTDETCGLSLLELEARTLKGKPDLLAQRFIARRDWALQGAFLHLYWVVAEQINDAGATASARAMWEIIRDKGPADAPEVQFSKARLDPTRTEFEKLWD